MRQPRTPVQPTLSGENLAVCLALTRRGRANVRLVIVSDPCTPARDRQTRDWHKRLNEKHLTGEGTRNQDHPAAASTSTGVRPPGGGGGATEIGVSGVAVEARLAVRVFATPGV